MDIACDRCAGRGFTTHQEPKPLGRCSGGEIVTSSHTVPINRWCAACAGRGRLPDEAPPTLTPGPEPTPILIGGHAVDAPGFTPDQFERAIVRALIDQLEIHEAAGCWLVCHRGVSDGYRTTRTRCDCPAGQAGTPCKHRAALIFHLDVREPAFRSPWQPTAETTTA